MLLKWIWFSHVTYIIFISLFNLSLSKNLSLLSTINETSQVFEETVNEKFGKLKELSQTTNSWGTKALERELPSVGTIDDMQERQLAFQGKVRSDQRYSLSEDEVNLFKSYKKLFRERN